MFFIGTLGGFLLLPITYYNKEEEEYISDEQLDRIAEEFEVISDNKPKTIIDKRFTEQNIKNSRDEVYNIYLDAMQYLGMTIRRKTKP